MRPPLSIEEVTHRSLEDVVNVHMRAYQGQVNFTRELGRGFTRFTYSYFLAADGCVALLAREGGSPAGFVAASPFVSFGPLQSYRKSAALFALMRQPWLVFKTSVGGRILGRLTSAGGGHDVAMPVSNYLFVYSIAVDPGFQGRGVGKALLAGLDACARERGIENITIAVGETNTASLALCEASGFAVIDGPHDGQNIYLQKPVV